ncbi:hypothetical protein RBB50_004889 [Rhinocladiella similis]
MKPGFSIILLLAASAAAYKIVKTHHHTFADGKTVTRTAKKEYNSRSKDITSETRIEFKHPGTGELFYYKFRFHPNDEAYSTSWTSDADGYDSDGVERIREL